MNKIPVVLVCDKNFIMPTSVTITSLLDNKNSDTYYDIYILGGDLDEEAQAAFKPLEKYGNCRITCIKRPLDRFSDIIQLANISSAGLLKFEICDIITDYDKILYIDSDMIIREDLWKLYDESDVSDCFFAAVIHSECIIDGAKRINSGFILFNAVRMRRDNMSEKLIQHRRALGNRKSMDQQTFNEVCGNHIKYLSPRYNCMPYRYMKEQIPQYYTMDEFNSFYGTSYKNWKDAVKDAAVIHYITGNKPWIYNDVYCGDEWYGYYLKSQYGKKKLKRKGKLDRLKNISRKDGVSGVVEYYIKSPLRACYYSMRSLEFRKSKWIKNTWG